MNSHRHDIAHRRTDDFPVAEHFNGGAHLLADMKVMVIDQMRSRDHVYVKLERAGGSGPWGLHSFQQWTSGSILCDACSNTIWGPSWTRSPSDVTAMQDHSASRSQNSNVKHYRYIKGTLEEITVRGKLEKGQVRPKRRDLRSLGNNKFACFTIYKLSNLHAELP